MMGFGKARKERTRISSTHPTIIKLAPIGNSTPIRNCSYFVAALLHRTIGTLAALRRCCDQEGHFMIINKSTWAPMAVLLITAISLPALTIQDEARADQSAAVMLILRGIANSENPRGQLDDGAALEFARRLGFRGEVLDVAGEARAHSPQVGMALDRIHQDEKVAAIYGFSAGGYNVRRIWKELTAEERERIEKVVVVGSPGVASTDFPGKAEVLIKQDPPAGHLAGPKILLESLDGEPAVPLKEAKPTTVARQSSAMSSAGETRTVGATASYGSAGVYRNRTSRDVIARQPNRAVKRVTRVKRTARISSTSD